MAAHAYDDPFGVDLPPLEAYADDPSYSGEQVDYSGEPGGLDPKSEEAFQARQAERERERAELFDRLNPRQAQAVDAPSHSLLVLAGAGSGKTSVLTARIAKLVSLAEVSAHGVLAVTFTNKAAQEMRHRLGKLLDKRSVQDMWMGTFHSLCNKLLRENYQAAGLPKAFAILDTDGQEALCRGVLKDFGLTKASVKESAKLKAAAAQADMLSAADPLAAAGALAAEDLEDNGEANEFVTPGQCAKYISSRKEKLEKPNPSGSITTLSTPVEQMEAVYAEYELRCSRSGLLDFQDLLTKGVELLRSDPVVRDKYRARFGTILVDEFQDTNDIQYEWIELMKGKNTHVMAVGDDSQSIYGFRGANPSNMGRFVREITSDAAAPEGRVVKLEQNYRSLPHILEAANAIIDRNPNQLKKTLFTAQPDRGERIDLVTFKNGFAEATAIATSIHRLIKKEKSSPAEVAILYRTNQQSRLLEQELNKLGVPLTVYGGYRFYERQEIKHMLAYLDLVCDVTRDISFGRVVNFPPRGIGERTIEELRQDAQGKRVSMMEMVGERSERMARDPSLLGNAAAQKKQRQLEGFSAVVLDLADAAQTMSLSKLIEEVLDRAAIREHYLAEAGGSKSSQEEAEERLSNIGELVSAARQFELENPALTAAADQLPEYLAYVALMTSTSESDMSRKNTVSLMTVHSSKGLEFDHVFIAGLEEATFPHARAIAEDEERGNGMTVEEAMRDMGVPIDEAEDMQVGDDYVELEDGEGMQEERRLMYVAVTRARKTLMLSHANQRLLNGEPRPCEPSRFLLEIPQDRLNHIDETHSGFTRSAGNREYGGDAFDAGRQEFHQRASTQSPPQAGLQRPELRTQSQLPVADMAPIALKHAPTGDSPPTPSSATVTQQTAQATAVRKPWQLRGAAAQAAASERKARTQLSAVSTPEQVPAIPETPTPPCRSLAIIGTAGRDKDKPLTGLLWARMVTDAKRRVRATDTLVSGGAAWADHLAVRLFLDGDVQALVLHLPAPLVAGKFQGERDSSASAANYYHGMFTKTTGSDSLSEIAEAIAKGAMVTEQPSARGYGAMFTRNALVAKAATEVLAYTFGDGDTPADGGTKNTWDQIHGQRHHVALTALLSSPENKPFASPLSTSRAGSYREPIRTVPPAGAMARLELLGKQTRRNRP